MAAYAYSSDGDFEAHTPSPARPQVAPLADVLQGRSSVLPAQRLTYLLELRHVIQQQPSLPADELEKILLLANHLCDWSLIKHIGSLYSSGLQGQQNMSLMAYADWKLGHWEQAYHSLQQQMFQYPNRQEIYLLYLDLLNYADLQGLHRFARPEQAPELSLEPLSEHHCQEFMWQYWDPDIPRLCCLPELYTEQDWFNWLHQQQSFHDQSTFAVLHGQWGFIGVVSLIVHQGVGFFYYWLGKDFRAQGLGTQAASLLLALGTEYFGIDCCYAKVFSHNVSSQKAMGKLGFKPLPFNAASPDESECLYYWGEVKTAKQNAHEMALLFARMSSTTRVDMPLSWQFEL